MNIFVVVVGKTKEMFPQLYRKQNHNLPREWVGVKRRLRTVSFFDIDSQGE